ncbi:MAG: hypothetical protein ACE5KV_00765, partial [Thermoplasmata archaeon]
FLAGLSLLLFLASLISYTRVKNIKILLVSIAFLLFFVKGLLLAVSILVDAWNVFGMKAEFLLFDVIVVVMLYLSVAMK